MEHRKARFYTLPPTGIEYPYLFVTFKQRRELLKRRFEHAIMDSNVGLFFFHMKLREYPKEFLDVYVHIAKNYSEMFDGRIFITIPDYPADYYINGKPTPSAEDNVERTIINIKKLIKIGGVDWLPVIQSKYMDTFSFINSCRKVMEIVGSDYPQIAIGTICKSRNVKWIKYCCEYTRKIFPKTWIHAFGLTLKALPHVKNHIDSWDSTAWTFPRTPGKWSYKNKNEKVEYFTKYIERINKILSNNLHLPTSNVNTSSCIEYGAVRGVLLGAS